MTEPLSLKIYHRVEEIGEAAWDELSAGRPFQSAVWYRYGQAVMDDCKPIYLVVYKADRPIARATFWVIRQEPLPIPAALNEYLKPVFRRWPLLICRSPLSNSTGLILPESPLRDEALKLIVREAEKLARRLHYSFLVFDFLPKEEITAGLFPRDYIHTAGGDPDTRLDIHWETFKEYVDSRDRKYRQEIHRNQKKAEENQVQITKHGSVDCIEEALELIHQVENKYHSSHGSWFVNMLKYMYMVPSTFLAARTGQGLTACGLILYDNQAQIPVALGHDRHASYDYLAMLYANLEDAIERGCRTLHWGSGSYDIKRHLGFELEYDNHLVAVGTGWFSRLLTWIASPFFH